MHEPTRSSVPRRPLSVPPKDILQKTSLEAPKLADIPLNLRRKLRNKSTLHEKWRFHLGHSYRVLRAPIKTWLGNLKSLSIRIFLLFLKITNWPETQKTDGSSIIKGMGWKIQHPWKSTAWFSRPMWMCSCEGFLCFYISSRLTKFRGWKHPKKLQMKE